MNKSRPNSILIRLSDDELNDLKARVKASDSTQQDYILSLLFPTGSEEKKEDKTTVPECPICGAKMKLKTGKFGKFWGCSRYPNCSGTLDWSDSNG